MNLGKTDNNRQGRQALGRGIGALIPGRSETDRRAFFECPIHRIRRNRDQPRKHFDETALAELAQSIQATGVVQPLVVRMDGGDFRLIAGERRLRAATRVGLKSVPVVIKEVSPAEAFEIALVENIQRQDLNPVEEAEAFERLMRDRGYTQEQLANTLGKSRSAVANTLRLLNLPAPVSDRVACGEISAGAARALLALPVDSQVQTAQRASEEGLNVRQLESIARRVRQGQEVSSALDAEIAGEQPVAARATKPRTARNQWAMEEDERMRRKQLSTELSALLGVPVAIQSRGQGGTVEIRFRDAAQLDALMAQLGN